MNIIDSHLHLPARNNLTSLKQQKNKLLSELTTNSIKQGIVIPDNIENSTIGNLKQCIELFSKTPNIFLFGTVNILNDDLKKKESELNNYFKSNQIIGLKIFPGHDRHLPNDKRLEPFIELCLKYDKPLVIHTGENSGNSKYAQYNDPKYIVDIANQFPNLKIIISHLFWPKVEYCVEVTKSYPNISYDTSALADKEVILKTGKNKIKKSLEELIKKHKKKVLYGSDYGMCSIKDHIALVNSLDISEENKKDVFSKNTSYLFGF
jgi:hypothetical protein